MGPVLALSRHRGSADRTSAMGRLRPLGAGQARMSPMSGMRPVRFLVELIRNGRSAGGLVWPEADQPHCAIGISKAAIHACITSWQLSSPFRTTAGPICCDAQDGSPTMGEHAETINHILDSHRDSSFWPNPYIRPRAQSLISELPRGAVVMLVETARSARMAKLDYPVVAELE